MKNKNKFVVKDETGMRWFIHKNTKVIEPTNWKLQCWMESARIKKQEVQEKLYGKKK